MKEEDENEHGTIKAGAVVVYVGIVLANFEWFFDLLWTITSDFTSFTVEQIEVDEDSIDWAETTEIITERQIFFEERSLKEAAQTFCMAFLIWNTFLSVLHN